MTLPPTRSELRVGLQVTDLRRTGSIFYANINAGQAKGSIAAGTTLISSKTGITNSAAVKRYPTEFVYDEVISAGGDATLGGTLVYPSVEAGTLVITDGVETFTDDGSGNLVSDLSGGTDGTIVYATGIYDVTFASTPTGSVTADYQYVFDKLSTNGVPEIDLGMTSETITAVDFPLRAKFSVAAAIDLQKAHGISLEQYLTKVLGEYIKFAINENQSQNKKMLNSVEHSYLWN